MPNPFSLQEAPAGSIQREGGAGVGSPGAERSVGPTSPGVPGAPKESDTSPPACGPAHPQGKRWASHSVICPHLESPQLSSCGRDLVDGVAAAVFWGLISLPVQPWLPLGQDRTFSHHPLQGCSAQPPAPDLPQLWGAQVSLLLSPTALCHRHLELPKPKEAPDYTQPSRLPSLPQAHQGQ